MSQATSLATTLSDYQFIFDNALESYKRRTGKDLSSHPLFHSLEACHSPDDVVAIILRGLAQSRNVDDRLTKWLIPTVNVLCTLSATIGGSMVSSVDS